MYDRGGRKLDQSTGIKKVHILYFSPTGGTRKAATAIGQKIGKQLNVPITEIDGTKPAVRQKGYSFGKDDLVVLGMPTYAGRIPNKILPDLKAGLHGNGNTQMLLVSVYGNRDYGESLREMIFLAEENGFLPIAAAACVSAHAFSPSLAQERPDEKDLTEIENFAKRAAEKIQKEDKTTVSIEPERPIGPYYTPLKEDGSQAKFLKAKPVTDRSRCNQCGICANVCPMESISREDCGIISGICIKCQACVKSCPSQAKYFSDGDFLSHAAMLETNYQDRKENVFFIP